MKCKTPCNLFIFDRNAGRCAHADAENDCTVAHATQVQPIEPEENYIDGSTLVRGIYNQPPPLPLSEPLDSIAEALEKMYNSDPFKSPAEEASPLSKTQQTIIEVCDEVRDILLDKNRKYGDSAIHPKRVFSKASAIEQINVRIDDKISRIMSSQDDDIEDAELDLIGYLFLKRVAKRLQKG